MRGYWQAMGLDITGGGTLVLGHRSPKVRRQNFKYKYIGRMNDVNIWDKVLSPQEILKMSQGSESEGGNVKSWSDFKMKGNKFARKFKRTCPENC